MTKIVLGSSSPFRKQLLKQLIPDFDTCSPDIDETPHSNETPRQLVTRLALEKARAVAKQYPHALIISSDQISLLNGEINGKPGNFENAFKQLEASSGNSVTFLTSLCLYNGEADEYTVDVDTFVVHFRDLSSDAITRYLEKETPYNCAGSFKSEGLGIALFKKLEGDDPNSLIGLPLIKLVAMLKQNGIHIP